MNAGRQDESPEWSQADMDGALPAEQVLPKLFGVEVAARMLAPRRGRPRIDQPKQAVSLRLDAEVLIRFRETGPGWQTRINNALREWLRDGHDPAGGE